MQIISIHSVVGGVGKTLIALSSAIQVAQMGFKTAVIELPHGGVVLAAWLKDLMNRGAQLNAAETFRTGIPAIETMVNVKGCEWVKSKLALVLADPDPSEISDFNNVYVMGDHGVDCFRGCMAQWLEYFRNLKYDFVFIDNPAGVNFLGGTSIGFVLEQAITEKIGCKYHVWFASRYPHHEAAQTLYEMAIYSKYIERTRPRLILNAFTDFRWDPNLSRFDAYAQHPLWVGKQDRLTEILNIVNMCALEWDPRTNRENPLREISRIMNQQGIHGQIHRQLLRAITA